MSGAITIDDEDTANKGGGDKQALVVDTDDTLAPDDAAALAATQQALTAAQQRESDARRQAAAVQNENARLRDLAARERQRSTVDQKAVWAQSIESADNEIKAAKQAKKAARESGDVDAEVDADEILAAAIARKNHAAVQLATLGETAPDQTSDRTVTPQAQPQAEQWTPTPRAQQWFQDHPRFNNDPGYKATAIAVHNHMASQGLTEAANPDQYFATLNSELAKIYGDNHGAPPGADTMSGNRGGNGGGNGGSHAAPPNRGGGNAGSTQVLPLASNLGQIRVQYRQDGSIARASFIDQNTRENMDEGAKVCFPEEYQKDPRAAVNKYTIEQIKIAEEIKRGGNAGLVYGEGGTFR